MMNVDSPAAGHVRTVRGDVSAAELGFTHCHEHTILLPGPASRLNPDLLLDDLDSTIAELTAFHAIGGRTVVDAQPIGPERSPNLQRRVSEQSDVHLVATSGFHRAIYYDADHFRFHESAERLAERMVEEVRSGMAEYDEVKQIATTSVRAGLLKLASDYHVLDENTRKIAEAVAEAHLRTGAPILTHTERGTCGLEQVELFRSLGIEPSSLLISHLDRNPDIYLHQDVAASGAWLIYDGVSRVKYQPDSTLVTLIDQMVSIGQAERILLAMDMGPRTMWRSYGGGPGMNYLAEVFLPKLRRVGLDEKTVQAFVMDHPARALAFRQTSVE